MQNRFTTSAFFGAILWFSPTEILALPSSYEACNMLSNFVNDAKNLQENGISKEMALLSYFIVGAGTATFSMLDEEQTLTEFDRGQWKYMISLGLVSIANTAYAQNVGTGKEYEAAALAGCMVEVQRWKDSLGAG